MTYRDIIREQDLFMGKEMVSCNPDFVNIIFSFPVPIFIEPKMTCSKALVSAHFSPRDKTLWVLFFGMIWIWISDPESLRSWFMKRTDESFTKVDASVPLMHHDPNDLRSLIRIWITPKERAHYLHVVFQTYISL